MTSLGRTGMHLKLASARRPAAPSEDRFAAGLRGFGPLGIGAIFLIWAGNWIVSPLSALLVLAWAWRSRTPWREIGCSRPESWLRIIAIGLAFGVAFKLVMKAIVMPLLGAPPINQAFHYLVGNSAALPNILCVVLVGAAFGEEVLFRGYAFERFGKLFGAGGWAKALIVVLTSAWFGLEHYSPESSRPRLSGWLSARSSPSPVRSGC